MRISWHGIYFILLCVISETLEMTVVNLGVYLIIDRCHDYKVLYDLQPVLDIVIDQHNKKSLCIFIGKQIKSMSPLTGSNYTPIGVLIARVMVVSLCIQLDSRKYLSLKYTRHVHFVIWNTCKKIYLIKA